MSAGLQQLVLASGNAGKLREFGALLAPQGFQLVPQSELGVPEAEEPHVTFLENALAKARHASKLTGLPALADDSGLCVSALGNAPGVVSARFAALEGGERSDAANNALLLQKLAGVPDRRARYVAVLVLVRSASDPQPLVAEGVWHGQIAQAPQGTHGFGYDPLFLVPETGLTVAQMPAEQKNRLSHRAQALRSLLARLAEGW